jgi:Zn-dependent protease
VEVAAFVCAGWVLSICFHEFGHAIVAYWGGDYTVKDKGYLSLNIFKYTDPGMSLILPLVFLALGFIALPGAAVYIDHSKLRNRMWESAVAAAGPLFTALTAIAFTAPFWLHMPQGSDPPWMWEGLAFLDWLICFSFIFNLLPIPPFDGYGIIDPWLPRAIRVKMWSFGRIGVFVCFAALSAVQPLREFLFGGSFWLAARLSVSPDLFETGRELFGKNAFVVVVPLLLVLFLARRKSGSKTKGADEWYQAGNKLKAEQRLPQAIETYTQALKLQPNFPEVLHNRGLCQAIMGYNELAMRDFDAAISLKPDYADCWYNRAVCLAVQQKADDAYNSLAKAVSIDPVNLKAHARQDAGLAPLMQSDPRFRQLTS